MAVSGRSAASERGESGPFGNVDGASAEIRSVNSGFVEFSRDHGAIALRPSDQDVRILIGKMGVGKSVYLRRLHSYSVSRSINPHDHNEADHLAQNSSIFTGAYTRQAANTLTSASVRYFSEIFSAGDLTEMWKVLWRRAIVRSVINHFLYEDALSPYMSEPTRQKILRKKRIISDQEMPTSIVQEAHLLVETLRRSHPRPQAAKARNAALDLLQSPDWISLEYECQRLLRDSPELYFYIDAVDDEFRAAPSYWLRLQKGLFYQLYSFLREDVWRSKLHIVIAIRDLVLSSVYTSEHGHRYLYEPHHRVLFWTNDAMLEFLDRKAAALDDRYLVSPNASTPIERWLGITDIFNTVCDVAEPLEQYLIRHTRGTPRDIVQMGNTLCALSERAKSSHQTSVDETDLKRAVAARSADAAYFEINHCANQVESDLGQPTTQVQTPYSGGLEYSYNATARMIRDLVSELGKNRFEWDDVDRLRQRGREVFHSIDLDLPTILWQNGLLGYVPDERIEPVGLERCCFYSEPSVGSIEIWDGAIQYVLHPVLIDCLPSITPIGPPVVPVPGLCNH